MKGKGSPIVDNDRLSAPKLYRFFVLLSTDRFKEMENCGNCDN